jgi:hypothetical protein
MSTKKKPETFEWSWRDKTKLTLIQFLEKAEKSLEIANQNILDSEGDPCFSDWRKMQKSYYALGRLISQLKEKAKEK